MPTAPASTASAPTDTRLKLLRAGGGIVIVAVTSLAGVYAARYPWLVPMATLVCAWIGKALGIPIDGVAEYALQHMAPERATSIVIRTIASLPPEQQPAIAARVSASIRPPPPPVELVDVDVVGEDEPTATGGRP